MALDLRSGIAMSSGVGGRHGLDLELLRLWCKLAAVAPIGPLAWESSICRGCSPKKKKTNHNNNLYVKTKLKMFSNQRITNMGGGNHVFMICIL